VQLMALSIVAALGIAVFLVTRPSSAPTAQVQNRFHELKVHLIHNKELDIHLSFQFPVTGHGVTVTTGIPLKARLAYRRPAFLFQYEPAFGPSSAKWFWLKDQELTAFESYGDQASSTRKPRGVRTKNYLTAVDGNEQQGFVLACKLARKHMVYIGDALDIIEVLDEADPKKMNVLSRDNLLILEQPAADFTGRIPFLSEPSARSQFFASFELSQDARSLRGISLVSHSTTDGDHRLAHVSLDKVDLLLSSDTLTWPDITAKDIKELTINNLKELESYLDKF